MSSASIIAPFSHLAPPSSGAPPVASDTGKADPPPPTPPTPLTLPPSSPETLEVVPESVTQSRAITKIKPDYPPLAKKMNATGTVEVEIIISEAGVVVDAKAISGHIALRNAAVEAARKWTFEPATLYGSPVKVKSVLSFLFSPSAK
jgi:periplasmic protein TonB